MVELVYPTKKEHPVIQTLVTGPEWIKRNQAAHAIVSNWRMVISDERELRAFAQAVVLGTPSAQTRTMGEHLSYIAGNAILRGEW